MLHSEQINSGSKPGGFQISYHISNNEKDQCLASAVPEVSVHSLLLIQKHDKSCFSHFDLTGDNLLCSFLISCFYPGHIHQHKFTLNIVAILWVLPLFLTSLQLLLVCTAFQDNSNTAFEMENIRLSQPSSNFPKDIKCAVGEMTFFWTLHELCSLNGAVHHPLQN